MAEFKATSICLFYSKPVLVCIRDYEICLDDLLMELCRLQRLFNVASQPFVLERMRSPANFRKPGNARSSLTRIDGV